MSTQIQSHSNQADYFTRHLEDMAPHRAILRAVEAKLMGQVPLTSPILDIGCGDGHFASITYKQPLDVGLDPMSRDLPEAAARVPQVYKHVLYGSATEMPFEDGAFKTVVSNCVIEHIPDNASVLREIVRVLQPGGLFATTLPSEHYPEYLLGSTLFRAVGLQGLGEAYGRFFNRISFHFHVYPPSTWRKRFDAVGLEVLDFRYYFSPAAHRAFDMSHYLGVPMLASKRLFGRWVLHPAIMKPYEHWLRPYYEEPWPESGAYQFFLCRKK